MSVIRKQNIRENNSIKRIFQLLAIVLPVLFATSCAIYDEDEDCDPYYYLQFVYDMNMDYADAFASKVSSVEVYAFDAKTGEKAGRFIESGDALKEEGYLMKLDLRPGEYDFIVWCGLENNEGHFMIPADINKAEDLQCTMARVKDSDDKSIQKENLHSLFHGRTSEVLPDKPGHHVYTVKLIKDTNNINFSLHETSGKELDPERFTIQMDYANGKMDFDNTLLDDENIRYKPYYQSWGTARVENTKADDEEEEVRHDIVQAELSTARLMADKNPTLDIIDNETGDTLYKIPLVRWALMLKSEQYADMKNQEYLDREDEYNVILYLNEQDDNYLAVEIKINTWRKIIHGNEELGN